MLGLLILGCLVWILCDSFSWTTTTETVGPDGEVRITASRTRCCGGGDPAPMSQGDFFCAGLFVVIVVAAGIVAALSVAISRMPVHYDSPVFTPNNVTTAATREQILFSTHCPVRYEWHPETRISQRYGVIIGHERLPCPPMLECPTGGMAEWFFASPGPEQAQNPYFPKSLTS
jgi:hypothetical protein